MRAGLRLYLRYVGASVRSQVQYRASFVLLGLSHFVATAAEFLALAALFQRFGSLRGWTLPEVALLYGMVHVSFAIAEGAGRGFDTFPSLVRSGDFDRLLLRPRSTALQVVGQELQLMRFGRLAQGLVVLIWGARAVPVPWGFPEVALLLAAIAGGACAFTGLFVLGATLSFWTVDSLEIVNTVTYGGTETAQLPLSIYRPWFRRFFTFVVPIACANYYPAHVLLGRDAGVPAPLLWATPLVGALFLAASLLAWRAGVRRYASTGS